MRRITGIIAFGVMLLLASLPARAQTPWLSAAPGSGVTLELLRPEFANGMTDAFSLASYLSYRHALNATTMLVGELPIVHGTFDMFGIEERSTALGNPYFGVRWRSATSPLTAEFGVRAPLAQDDEMAEVIGLVGDQDRMEAFLPDFLTLGTTLSTMVHPAESVVGLRLLLGSTLLVYTGNVEFVDDVEAFASYGVQFWGEGERLEVGAGVTGRALLTESGLDFGQRTVHQLGMTANLKFRGIRPGVHFRLPMDDDLDELDYVLGVHLTVPVGR